MSSCTVTPASEATSSLTRRPRILIGASGSVAAVKVPELALKLAAFAEVKIVVTKAGAFFLDKSKTYNPTVHEQFARQSRLYSTSSDAAPSQSQASSTSDAPLPIEIIHDAHEWDAWHVVGDRVLHIDLKDWADVLLLAPVSANTLAKLAHGLSDNLLTSVARAWSRHKPLVFAPAMNTDMWDHPATAMHLTALAAFNYECIAPVEKLLACGVVGVGGLAAVDDIVRVVHQKTQSMPLD